MKPIDTKKDRFPFCIVWTPLPCISWFLPFIGHVGIAYSNGVIRDFAGPYYVSEDNLAFGKTTRYVQLDPTHISGKQWDTAVKEASDEYNGRMHNLCCDNCHSHVAMALNLMEYKGKSSWNMVSVCWMLLIRGRFVNLCGFLKSCLPFFIIVATILLLAFLL
ncbi:unnamed protein product [Oikopleura dioica]|uniref:Transmembrane protein 222 n=1 Tax=Oikopleura dioica TaxID=34765 RepID=E4WWL7_OIKDI|nr:unnamed protein product [Oikopleura dioica]CBY39140.1 unnamed protein product [Oikopleura dioica]